MNFWPSSVDYLRKVSKVDTIPKQNARNEGLQFCFLKILFMFTLKWFMEGLQG